MNKWDLYKIENKRIREEWFKNHIADIESFDNGNLIKIKWREPGTWNMAVVYYIDCKMGYLCVCGDLGEGIYQWCPPININFLGGCELDYFNGKCQASSCGERGKTWNQEIATEYVKQYIEEFIHSGNSDSFYQDLFDDGHVEKMLITQEPGLALCYEPETERPWKKLTSPEKERFAKIADAYMEDLKSSSWKKLPKEDYRRAYIERKDKFKDLAPDALAACESEFQWQCWLHENGYDFFGDEYYEYGDIGRTISLRVQSHLIGLQMIREGIASGKYQNPNTKCPWTKLSNWFKKKFKKPQKT